MFVFYFSVVAIWAGHGIKAKMKPQSDLFFSIVTAECSSISKKKKNVGQGSDSVHQMLIRLHSSVKPDKAHAGLSRLTD